MFFIYNTAQFCHWEKRSSARCHHMDEPWRYKKIKKPVKKKPKCQMLQQFQSYVIPKRDIQRQKADSNNPQAPGVEK